MAGPGGFSDRFKGMMHTFLLSLVLNRAFFFFWDVDDPVGAGDPSLAACFR